METCLVSVEFEVFGVVQGQEKVKKKLFIMNLN